MKTKENIFLKGLIGTASPVGGLAMSLSEIEAWLRIASLLIGITVGILSAISIAKSLIKKKDNHDAKS